MKKIDIAVTVREGMPGTIVLEEENDAVREGISGSTLFTSVRWLESGLACFFVRDETIPTGIFETQLSSLFLELGVEYRVAMKGVGGI